MQLPEPMRTVTLFGHHHIKRLQDLAVKSKRNEIIDSLCRLRVDAWVIHFRTQGLNDNFHVAP